MNRPEEVIRAYRFCLSAGRSWWVESIARWMSELEGENGGDKAVALARLTGWR